MKKRTQLLCQLAVASLLTAGSTAFGYTVTLTAGSYQSGAGGEFKATVSDNSLDAYINSYAATTGNAAANTFQTFCIEHAENFHYGTAYDAQVTGAAISGGTLTQDSISKGTGWLYSQFAEGTLAGYAFAGTTTARKASSNALQKAIWWLEGEQSYSSAYLAANTFVQAVIAQFGATTPTVSPGQGGSGGAADDVGNTYGVFALNMGPFAGEQTRAQDQLIYQKPAEQRVPDGGATVLLLGLGLTGMGSLKRKWRKTQ